MTGRAGEKKEAKMVVPLFVSALHGEGERKGDHPAGHWEKKKRRGERARILPSGPRGKEEEEKTKDKFIDGRGPRRRRKKGR